MAKLKDRNQKTLSKEIERSDLVHLMGRLAHTRNYRQVFDDFLDICIYVFTMGQYKEESERLAKEYSDKEQAILLEMVLELGEESENHIDCLGNTYMSMVSHGHNGQYFTPSPVSDFMSKCMIDEPHENEVLSVCDPACGSGVMFLSTLKNNPGKQRNFRFFGADIDLTCCKMAAINLFMNGAIGEIAWGNSLAFEHWKSFLIIRGPLGFPILEIVPPEKGHFFTRWKATVEAMPPEQKKQVFQQLTLNFD